MIKLKNIFFKLKNMSKKKKLVTAAILIFAIGAAAFAVNASAKKQKRKDAMNSAFTTETAQIERQTLTDSISATGTVASAETKTVNTSLKDLEVVAVYVKEGDYVEEGTVICEFDASDYEEALAEAQHNAAINAQIDALEEESSANDSVETTYDTVLELTDSKEDAEDDYDDAKSDYQSAKNKLSSAASALSSAKASYEAVKGNLDEREALLKTYQAAYENAQKEYHEAFVANDPDVSEKEQTMTDAKAAYEEALADSDYQSWLAAKSAYENAQASYNSAQASVSSAKAAYEQAENRVDQLEEQLDSAWKSYDKAVEKADLQEAKENLQDQLITESQEDKAIDQYTELIDDCVVTASMSGVITSLNVTEGNVFEGGDVYTIQDNENFIVTCSVDEYDISSIQKGMPAYVKTDATGDTEMNGEVTYVAIAPSGNGTMGAISSSASYTVKVSIADADPDIRAGMTAKLSISLEESENALTVPYDAVTTNPDGSATITIDADGEKKTIPVETGLETDYYTEIISDEISEGMTVYLTTPLITSTPSGSEDESFGGFGIGMPGSGNGGGMPSGGGHGGNGMPGGPGDF